MFLIHPIILSNAELTGQLSCHKTNFPTHIHISLRERHAVHTRN